MNALAPVSVMTNGQKVIAFIERFCRVPDGKLVGQPLVLDEFQRQFILALYDNPAGTSRAYLSVARKNGKTALMAGIILAHICGPMAVMNSQVVSGARSRDQAALVFDLACKMIRFSPELSGRTRIVPSSKKIVGLRNNVEYRALSAEAGTAHGLSPIFALLDEVGQVKGDRDAFIEAIETSQGAHIAPILVAISTQAATDGDLFSKWIDEAITGANPRIVCHLYTAPADCALDDLEAIKAANPGYGTIIQPQFLADQTARALASPSFENSYRWLHLNQRVNSDDPFVSQKVWALNSDAPEIPDGADVYLGLDLSSTQDLTSLEMVALVKSKWQVVSRFWLPRDGIAEKSKSDRVPYDIWARDGKLELCDGPSIDYDFVAARIVEVHARYNVVAGGFDRYNMKFLKPRLQAAGLSESELSKWQDFGQGFVSMSPALNLLETDLLNGRVAHGGHPVLTMCAANAVVKLDPAGNRKFDKSARHRRIDGMVALAMARMVAGSVVESVGSPWDVDPNYKLEL